MTLLDIKDNSSSQSADSMFDIVPASEFTYKRLTDIYNQTRVDYVVPMPMNVDKFREYVFYYDLSLEHSVVAMDGDEALGLGMLGVRGKRTWITRLGVVPNGRKHGVGREIMSALVKNSENIDAEIIQLEVIKGNKPAEKLFLRFGFEPIRDLLVVRRPPRPVNIVSSGVYIELLDTANAHKLLRQRKVTSSWITDNESLQNAGDIAALLADLPNGAKGWLVYQNSAFQITRLVLQTDQGDPELVAQALLQNLHWRHSIQDTICENLPADDLHWPMMKEMGYVLSFTRTEMKKNLTD